IEKEEHAENLKISVLQAIHYIAKSWKEVGANTIRNFEEFLEIPDENIVYEVSSDEEIIRELVETFRTNGPAITSIEDVEDEDDGPKISIVSIDTANTSLETMRTFLLQQDDTEEYINILEKIE
ncbi:8116_t:CDS:2, partial [Cetraspora pellucida]